MATAGGPKAETLAIRELQEHLELTTGRYFDAEVAAFANAMANGQASYNTKSIEQIRNRHRHKLRQDTPEDLVRWRYCQMLCVTCDQAASFLRPSTKGTPSMTSAIS